MSLSEEISTKKLSDYSHTNSYVKVVYNKIKSNDYDDQSLNILSTKRIALEEQINKNLTAHSQQDINSQFINEYNKLYKTPDFAEQIKVIFLGKQKDDVTEELIKIVNNIKTKEGKGAYNNVNMELLSKELMYKNQAELIDDFDLKNVSEVVFSDIFISKTISINTLHKILANTLTNNQEKLFTQESIYMYGEKQQHFIEFQYKNLKRKIIGLYRENPANITSEIIKKFLGSYNIPDFLSNYILKEYQNTASDLNSIFENEFIKEYIHLYLRFNNLTFNYTHRDGLNYPIDSCLDYYLSDVKKHDRVYKYKLNSSNVVFSDLKKKSTIDDLFIEKNCIYLYNFYNIIETIEKSSTNLDDRYKQSFYNTFIIKYFPQLKSTQLYLNSSDKSKLIQVAAENKDIVYNFSNINRIFNNYKNNGIDEMITVKEDKPHLVIIKKEINIPSDFDYTYLFNELKLDEEIPFVKFRDTNGTRDIVYKIFKPIIKKQSTNHYPKVSRDILDSWIKFKGFDIVNYDLKKMRANPKNISFRHKFLSIKDDVEMPGKILMINDDTCDILSDKGILYTEIPHENINQTSDSLSLGSEVVFFKNNIIFAEIDLYKKKYLEFVLDLRDFNKMADISTINIDKNIQDFINKIFSTDSLARFKDINNGNNLGYNFKVGNNHITNLIYKYNFEINSTLKLDYESFEKAAKILYPFIIVDEDLFQPDTRVEYFYKDTPDSEGIWVKSIITEINIDFTYNLRFTNLQKKTVIKENVDKVLLRLPDIKSSKVFKFSFKQISGFSDMSSINKYLAQLNDIGLDCSSQIKKIMDTFLLKEEESSKLVKEYVKESVLSDISRGVGLTILYSKSLHSQSDKNNIDIFVENINSESQVSELYFFIKFFINIAQLIKGNSALLGNSIFTELLSDKFIQKDGTIIVSEMDTSLKKHTFDDMANESEDDYDIDNDYGSDNDYDTDESDSDESEQDELDEDILEQLDTISSIGQEVKSGKTEEVQIDSINNNSSLISRLYAADKLLFDSLSENSDSKQAGKQVASYSRKCQQITQPLVMNDKDKTTFDKEFQERSQDWTSDSNENPISAYSANAKNKKTGKNFEYIDCDSETIKKLDLETQQCKSIKIGSSMDTSLHNWYMCPKIYDAFNNKPIHIKDIKFDGLPDNSSEKFNPDPINWRTHKSSNMHNGVDIVKFRPYYQKTDDGIKQTLMEGSKATNKQNLVFRKSSYSPGFIGDGMVPCCAKVTSNKLKNKWIGSTSERSDSSYIKKWGASLSLGSNGLINDIMEPFFANHTTKNPNAESGAIKNSLDQFIRYGQDNNPNNIFNVFAKLHKISSEDIINSILINLSEKSFMSINNGNMFTQFNFTGIQSSFQNFMEYTISDQHKMLEFYMELLSQKKHRIVNENINVIVLEIDSSSKKLNLICPSYYENNFENTNSYAFILKKMSGEFYEPLYVHRSFPRDYQQFVFNNEELKAYPNLSNIFKVFENGGSCSIEKPSALHNDNNIFKFKRGPSIKIILDILQIKLTDKFKLDSIVLDDNNKAVGILLNDNITIPVYPEAFSGAYSTKRSTDVGVVNLKKLEEAFTLINNQLTEDNKITIIDYYSKNDTHGALTNTGNYLRLDSKPQPKDGMKSVIKVDYHKVDTDLFKHKRLMNMALYKPTLDFDYVKNTIDELENYKITQIVRNKPKSSCSNGIVITNTIGNKLFIPIEIKKITYISAISGMNAIPIIDKFEIDTELSTYMNSIIQFAEKTKYTIYCIPVRGLFDESKKYTKLILETGNIININSKNHFSIVDKDRHGNFLLNELIDSQLVNRLFSNIKININNDLLNTRIKTNLKFNYYNSVTGIIKNQIYEIFQNPYFLKIKEFIEFVIKNPIIKNKYKKILIKPIFRLIIDAITDLSGKIDIRNFTKVVNYKLCSQNNCDTQYCLSSKYISEIDYYTDNLIIQIALTELHKNTFDGITNEEISNFKTKIGKIDESILSKLYEIHKNTVSALLEQESICKLKILNNTTEDIFSFNKIKNTIFNELIFNKYVSFELLNFTNKGLMSGELQFDYDNEIIFNSSDYSTSLLNKLYIYKLNDYYNMIIPFEKSIQRLGVVELDNIKNIGENMCFINLDKVSEYIINTKVCGSAPKLNKNTSGVNSLHVILSSDDTSKLKILLESQ